MAYSRHFLSISQSVNICISETAERISFKLAGIVPWVNTRNVPTDLWRHVVSAVRRALLAMYSKNGLVDFYKTWWAYIPWANSPRRFFCFADIMPRNKNIGQNKTKITYFYQFHKIPSITFILILQ